MGSAGSGYRPKSFASDLGRFPITGNASSRSNKCLKVLKEGPL